jgi:hypothetical protein
MPGSAAGAAERVKVFWFFFAKKNDSSPLPCLMARP